MSRTLTEVIDEMNKKGVHPSMIEGFERARELFNVHEEKIQRIKEELNRQRILERIIALEGFTEKLLSAAISQEFALKGDITAANERIAHTNKLHNELHKCYTEIEILKVSKAVEIDELKTDIANIKHELNAKDAYIERMRAAVLSASLIPPKT